MHLDIAVGEAKVDEEGEKEHVKDLAGKVKDLNARLADIAREQRFQREREEEFRSLSERTNARAVYWSIAQMVTLLVTCTWQLRHLRRFFESKKLSVLSPLLSSTVADFRLVSVMQAIIVRFWERFRWGIVSL